jgi:hypothetical protein
MMRKLYLASRYLEVVLPAVGSADKRRLQGKVSGNEIARETFDLIISLM